MRYGILWINFSAEELYIHLFRLVSSHIFWAKRFIYSIHLLLCGGHEFNPCVRQNHPTQWERRKRIPWGLINLSPLAWTVEGEQCTPFQYRDWMKDSKIVTEYSRQLKFRRCNGWNDVTITTKMRILVHIGCLLLVKVFFSLLIFEGF